MRQHVTGAQHREQVGDLGREAAQARLGGRGPRFGLQVWAVDRREHRQAADVQKAVVVVNVGRLQLELASEQLQHLGRHAGLDLEAHHAGMTPAAPELGLDRGQQVFGVAVHVVEVTVARDAEGMVRDDLHPWEKRGQVQSDHILERDVALGPDSRKIEGDEARQDRRHLDSGEPLLLALRVADHHRQVERKVRDVGERVTRVDRQRRQHREDLLPEDGVQLAQLLLADLLPAHQRDPGFGEGGHDLAVVDPELAIDQPFDPVADRPQLLQRRHAVGRGDGDGGQHLLLEARHTHLEEVVQVLAEDGQEPNPLQERKPGVSGHAEDPLVEVKPRQLPVDVAGADRREDRRGFRLGVGSDRHKTNFSGCGRGPG